MGPCLMGATHPLQPSTGHPFPLTHPPRLRCVLTQQSISLLSVIITETVEAQDNCTCCASPKILVSPGLLEAGKCEPSSSALWLLPSFEVIQKTPGPVLQPNVGKIYSPPPEKRGTRQDHPTTYLSYSISIFKSPPYIPRSTTQRQWRPVLRRPLQLAVQCPP